MPKLKITKPPSVFVEIARPQKKKKKQEINSGHFAAVTSGRELSGWFRLIIKMDPLSYANICLGWWYAPAENGFFFYNKRQFRTEWNSKYSF